MDAYEIGVTLALDDLGLTKTAQLTVPEAELGKMMGIPPPSSGALRNVLKGLGIGALGVVPLALYLGLRNDR